MARYCGCKIDPTPVRSPQKKGKVESAVKYVCRNFLAAGASENIQDANADLPDWLRSIAGQRIHGTTGRRPLEAFAEEQSALLPLPAAPYEPVVWKEATVHTDSHVEFERQALLGALEAIGRRVWIKATPATVAIYLNDQRLATHERRGKGRMSTDAQHLPEHRAALAQRSLSFWTERADALGSDVGTYIRHVIASDDVLSKLRDVQAIVGYLEQFPAQRARPPAGGRTTLPTTATKASGASSPARSTWSHCPHRPQHGRLAAPRFARSVLGCSAPSGSDMTALDDLVPVPKLRLSGVLQSLDLRLSQATDDDISTTEFLYRLLADEVERREASNFSFVSPSCLRVSQVFRRLRLHLQPRAAQGQDPGSSSGPSSHPPTSSRRPGRCRQVPPRPGHWSTGLSVWPSALSSPPTRCSPPPRRPRRGTTIVSWPVSPRLGSSSLMTSASGLSPTMSRWTSTRSSANATKGSTLITSNRDITEWYPLFGDALLATAAMDRLLPTPILVLDGRSFRTARRPDRPLLWSVDPTRSATQQPLAALPRSVVRSSDPNCGPLPGP